MGLIFFGAGIVIAAMYAALYNDFGGIFLQLMLVTVFIAGTWLLVTWVLGKVMPKEVT